MIKSKLVPSKLFPWPIIIGLESDKKIGWAFCLQFCPKQEGIYINKFLALKGFRVPDSSIWWLNTFLI